MGDEKNHGVCLIALSLFFLFSMTFCVNKTVKETNRKTDNMREIVGCHFVMPGNAEWVISDRDTTVQFRQIPKMIVYYNGGGCTPCSLKELKHWKQILKQTDKLNVDVVFILHTTKENKEVIQAMREQEFDYPVMFDEEGEFEKYNLLPRNNMLHTFLLDKNDKVVLADNPLIGYNRWKLFENTIKQLNR